MKPKSPAATTLELFHAHFHQILDPDHPLYQLADRIDAPEAECVSKDKVYKWYEFGNKVSVATTNKDSWVVGMLGLHGNPYDGHTLSSAVAQVERITSMSVEEVFADKGYRGHDYRGDAEVYVVGQRGRSHDWPALKRRKRRRVAVEPKIGHLKSDNRMGRSYFQDAQGDLINALLAGIGANIRKLLATFCTRCYRGDIFSGGGGMQLELYRKLP